jgi:hypothetical protein
MIYKQVNGVTLVELPPGVEWCCYCGEMGTKREREDKTPVKDDDAILRRGNKSPNWFCEECLENNQL